MWERIKYVLEQAVGGLWEILTVMLFSMVTLPICMLYTIITLALFVLSAPFMLIELFILLLVYIGWGKKWNLYSSRLWGALMEKGENLFN